MTQGRAEVSSGTESGIALFPAWFLLLWWLSDCSSTSLALQTLERCVVGKAEILLYPFKLPFHIILGAMPILGQTMFFTVHESAVILTCSSVQVKIKQSRGNDVDIIGYYYYLFIILLKGL